MRNAKKSSIGYIYTRSARQVKFIDVVVLQRVTFTLRGNTKRRKSLLCLAFFDYFVEFFSKCDTGTCVAPASVDLGAIGGWADIFQNHQSAPGFWPVGQQFGAISIFVAVDDDFSGQCLAGRGSLGQFADRFE